VPRLLTLTVALLLLAGCSASPAPPPADLRTSVVDFGGFGPFRIGMTLTEVRQANAGKLPEAGLANGCVSFVDNGTTADLGSALQLLVTPDDGGHLVGIRAPITARTAKGIGIGSTRADVAAAYAGFPLTDTESQEGHVALVRQPGTEDYLGFTFDGSSVEATAIGTRGFAAGGELCSG
jgi:hypothetical protein